MNRKSNGLFSMGLGLVALVLVGCDNQTSKSLCENANGPIEGISGIYQLNYREAETFGIETKEIKIMPSGKGHTYSVKKDDDDDTGMTICSTGGQYILESKDDETGMFNQMRLYTSQVGIHVNPVLYDKRLLDAAGIPNKVVAVPSKARSLIGSKWADRIDGLAAKALSALDDEEYLTLMIDNSGVSPGALLQYSKPAFVGFTIFRK